MFKEGKAIGTKILVIEDDPNQVRFLTHIFEREGYEVINASNGLVGLKKAREENPSLLLLDIMLPGLDGFEVCHRLRSDSTTSALPIIMMSAKGQDTDKATALRVGANEFFVKPMDRVALLSKILELLGLPKKNISTPPDNSN
jgi:DNA-binding response OmpR family regulator